MKSALASQDSPTASAQDIAVPAGEAPVRFFAWLGAAWVLLIGYVVFNWVTADYFGPTPTGPDEPPFYVIACIRFWETWMATLALWLIWECIVKPWRRDGEPSSDGLLAVSGEAAS